MTGLARDTNDGPPDFGCGCVVGLLLAALLAVAFIAGVMYGGGCGK